MPVSLHRIVSLLFALSIVFGSRSSCADTVLLHAHDSLGNLYTVDVDTGAAFLIGNTSTVFWDIAFDENGRLYGVSSGQNLYEIDPSTARAAFIGPTGSSLSPNALVFDENGILWAAGGTNLATIDTDTGQAAVFAPLWPYGSAGDLAFDAEGRLYLTTAQGVLLEIDPVDGSIAERGFIPDVDVYGFARGPEGVMYGLTAQNSILDIDVETGQAIYLRDVVPDFDIGETYGTSFATEICGDIAPISTAPGMNESLWRSQNNVILLTYAIEVQTPPRNLLLQELLPSGDTGCAYGPDLSDAFTISIDPVDPFMVRVEENGSVLQHGSWYTVRNCAFERDFVVMVGDASNDNRTLSFDVDEINGGVPCFDCCDDRRDINGDCRILSFDVSITNNHIPSFAPPSLARSDTCDPTESRSSARFGSGLCRHLGVPTHHSPD